MKITLKNPTQPNPPLIYLIIFVSLLSLFSLSCSKNKINGLEKYNGNVYVSLNPVDYSGNKITEATEANENSYYRWLAVKNGMVYYDIKATKAKGPNFSGDVGNDVQFLEAYYPLIGSGTSYSETSIGEYYEFIRTLEFSEDGNSATFTETINHKGNEPSSTTYTDIFNIWTKE